MLQPNCPQIKKLEYILIVKHLLNYISYHTALNSKCKGSVAITTDKNIEDRVIEKSNIYSIYEEY